MAFWYRKCFLSSSTPRQNQPATNHSAVQFGGNTEAQMGKKRTPLLSLAGQFWSQFGALARISATGGTVMSTLPTSTAGRAESVKKDGFELLPQSFATVLRCVPHQCE